MVILWLVSYLKQGATMNKKVKMKWKSDTHPLIGSNATVWGLYNTFVTIFLRAKPFISDIIITGFPKLPSIQYKLFPTQSTAKEIGSTPSTTMFNFV